MKKSNTTPTLEQCNNAITGAFQAIMKETKELIASLPQEMLRHTILVKGNNFTKPKVLEFITPLTYLCLREVEGLYFIHFGYDQGKEFIPITSQFIRLIYKLTMKEVTNLNIEDCIITRSIVTDTAGLIDYMQWKHQSLPVKVIKYKPITVGSKRSLSVA